MRSLAFELLDETRVKRAAVWREIACRWRDNAKKWRRHTWFHYVFAVLLAMCVPLAVAGMWVASVAVMANWAVFLYDDLDPMQRAAWCEQQARECDERASYLEAGLLPPDIAVLLMHEGAA